MLVEETLFGTIDKVKESIQFLKDFEPPEGYYLAFSGGKDSVVIKALADMAGVKYDAHYSVTTIDPPEVVYFVRDIHPDVEFDLPSAPLLTRLVKKGFPSRRSRWCCDYYKERGGSGRVVITGVRRAESARRSKRKAVEPCYRDPTRRRVNPILNWSDDEVWEFININKIPYCSLYDEGFNRIGCLMCPIAGTATRRKEADRYPRYVEAFRRAFRKLYNRRVAEGQTGILRWKGGDEMFDWWMEHEEQGDPDQTVLFE